jgi:hypothetical protein
LRLNLVHISSAVSSRPRHPSSASIPALIEQRRIERYSKIRGSLQPGYFTLRPRQTEEGFKRADNAHIDVLSWIKNTLMVESFLVAFAFLLGFIVGGIAFALGQQLSDDGDRIEQVPKRYR